MFGTLKQKILAKGRKTLTENKVLVGIHRHGKMNPTRGANTIFKLQPAGWWFGMELTTQPWKTALSQKFKRRGLVSEIGNWLWTGKGRCNWEWKIFWVCTGVELKKHCYDNCSDILWMWQQYRDWDSLKKELWKRNTTVFANCHLENHIYGTGFIVPRKVILLVTDFKTTDHTFCSLHEKGGFSPITDMCWHTSSATWGRRNEYLLWCPGEGMQTHVTHNDKIVVGDMNVNNGTERIFKHAVAA